MFLEDQYPYLGTLYYLKSVYLRRIGTLHFYLHVRKNIITQYAYQVFGAVVGEHAYLFVVFMLISILSTSLVLKTFVSLKFLTLYFSFAL